MPQKYYAVRVGKKPGIYVDYHTFTRQLRGYKNAEGKSFMTESEAREWLGPDWLDDAIIIAKLETRNIALQQELKSLKEENQLLKEEPFRFFWPDENGEIKDRYVIFTDGSCILSNNSAGIGGWAGIIIHFKDIEIHKIQGIGFLTTPPRMEITAVSEAIKQIPEGATALVYTDFEATVNAAKGIKSKSIIENADIWEEIQSLCQKRNITFGKVKAHADNPFNNCCDEMAKEIARAFKPFQDHLIHEEKRKASHPKVVQSGTMSPRTFLKSEPQIKLPPAVNTPVSIGIRIQSYQMTKPGQPHRSIN